jgi:serine acetyltransferase
MGSVIGARALVRQPLPRRVAAVGTPARVLRQEVSWGRDLSGMTDAERISIGLPPLVPA